MFHYPRSRFFNPEHLKQTHEFYEKYGGKTIIIARFVPIVRTFAPFVAGIGAMSYRRFVVYNVVGGVLWVAVCVGAGYLFGNLPFVKKNFSLVILGIIAVSVMPALVEYLRQRAAARRARGLAQRWAFTSCSRAAITPRRPATAASNSRVRVGLARVGERPGADLLVGRLELRREPARVDVARGGARHRVGVDLALGRVGGEARARARCARGCGRAASCRC